MLDTFKQIPSNLCNIMCCARHNVARLLPDRPMFSFMLATVPANMVPTQARPTQPIWFYFLPLRLHRERTPQNYAALHKRGRRRNFGGGGGAERLRDCNGWHHKQFLFFIFYCPLPTHFLAFQYISVWMRHSGAHPAAGGRYRGGAPPACHHNTCISNQRQLKCCHDLLLLSVRAAARSGDRGAS